MYRRFLERMIGSKLIVTATVQKFGRSFGNTPGTNYCLDNPVTANGVLIGDHIWIKQSDFVKIMPIKQGQVNYILL